MKEINEELQMQIFDLLEGNLSDKEKAEVLNLIAKSPLLQKEYDLMSKTYLREENEDKILFADKHKLYRKGGLVLAFNPMMRYAAAGAALIICGVAGWYFSRQQPETQTAVRVEKVRPNTDSISKGIEPAFAEQNQTENSQKTQNQKVYEGTEKNIEKPEPTPVFVENIAPKEQEIAPDKIAVIVPEIVENTQVVTEVVDTATANISGQQGPIGTSKKRSLSYKLVNNARQMLANLQLPDVKFRAEKNNNGNIPTIKMEIHTLKTDVIATLIE